MAGPLERWVLLPLFGLVWCTGWLALYAFWAWTLWYALEVPRMMLADGWQAIPADWHGEVLIALGVVVTALVLFVIIYPIYEARTGGHAATHQAFGSGVPEFGFDGSEAMHVAAPAMDIDAADFD